MTTPCRIRTPFGALARTVPGRRGARSHTTQPGTTQPGTTRHRATRPRATRHRAASPRTAMVVLAALATASLPACTSEAAGGGTGEVVVTTNILGDITQEIVGEEAGVTVLMQPDADPHSFAISAREANTFENASLVVHNGLGLEEGVAHHVEAAEGDGVATLSVGDEVDPLPYTDGDSSGNLDPHFWTDPERGETAARVISEAVIEQVEGVDEEQIRENTDRYLTELSELDSWIAETFADIPVERRQLVTNHHVFGYLADRFDFEVIGSVIPSGTTLASPSGSDLDELATTIRETGVPAIFVDSSQPDRLAQVLAEEAGLEVEVAELYSESLTDEGGGAATYLEMLRVNTETIATALDGE